MGNDLKRLLGDSRWSLCVATVSTLAVLYAISCAGNWLRPPELRPGRYDGQAIPRGFTAGDAEAYLAIAEHGYITADQPLSKNVFFPLLPLLMGVTATATNLSPVTMGVTINLIAYAFLVVLFLSYAKQRGTTLEANYALVVFSLLPTTLFFRAIYTESLFCLWEVLLLFGMLRSWKLRWLAFFCALGAVTRPVGIALTIVLAYHVWSTEENRDRIRRAILATIPTIIALALFSWIQSWSSGNPTSFIVEQTTWSARWQGVTQWLIANACLEPFTCPWRSDTIGYWGYFAPSHGLINYTFWNPLIWLMIISLMFYGGWKGWLSKEELLLVILIVAIPYWLQAYRTGFTSQGRYVSVALPCYLVAGKVLQRWPSEARWTAVIPAAVLLIVFACQYSAGYFVV